MHGSGILTAEERLATADPFFQPRPAVLASLTTADAAGLAATVADSIGFGARRVSSYVLVKMSFQ